MTGTFSHEETGVSSRGLLGFLSAWEEVGDRVQFHSLILLHHGKRAFTMSIPPYDMSRPHSMFSLSKSFTSAAAGFAVSEGRLSWDTPVISVLKEDVPEGREEELKGITLEALLCMGSGLAPESDTPSPDPKITWARHVLSHPVLYPPMTHFHYNSFGTYLVSCMVQKVTGQTVRDYLVPRLFEPLGLGAPEWDMSPEGISCGGFGLHLSTEGVARFGQLLLQKGMWQGRRILPEGWVELATRKHIANDQGKREEGNEWAQGYGFQFWRCMDGRYRGDGAMGQACFVDEKRDAVLAVTCGTPDMGLEFRLIREHLFPALDAQAGTEADRSELALRLARFGYGLPENDGSGQMPGGVFTAGDGKCAISFSSSGEETLLLSVFREDRPSVTFPLGVGKVCEKMQPGPFMHPGMVFRGSCVWREGRLLADLRTAEGPESWRGSFTPQADGILFEGTGVDFPDGHVLFERKGIQEKSCGAVVYRQEGSERFFLLEHMVQGHTSIPKGHVEGEETERETALREIREETNLQVELDTAFRHAIVYSPSEGVIKEVVFFVARALPGQMIRQESEVNALEWMRAEEALAALTHESDRETLTLAMEYLKTHSPE